MVEKVNEQSGNVDRAQKKFADKDRMAVDRPGFDLGGSTGRTSAGTGLGLGVDAAEDRGDRSLPRHGAGIQPTVPRRTVIRMPRRSVRGAEAPDR